MTDLLLILLLVLLAAVAVGLIQVLRRLRVIVEDQRRLREQLSEVYAVVLEIRERPAGFPGVGGSGSGGFLPVSLQPQPAGNPALTGLKLPQPPDIISTTEVERLAKSFLKQ